ncbi:MAG: DMT family transporter [Cyclobacteriaceae bacterium]
MKKSTNWLLYAIITTIFWGAWGAIIEIPEKNGLPPTMGYIAWAITMVPCAFVALYIINWNLERDLKSIGLGLLVGLTGAGGQLILFQALKEGPAYIIFPIVSLYPILTISLSMAWLKESATKKQYIGIALALIAIFLLSYSKGDASQVKGVLWLILAALVFLMWGLQAFAMKFSNNTMKAESIFFYMTIAGLGLTPIAYFMTDFSQEINFGMNGAYLAVLIHFLNSIGALTLVYALRYGKALIVVPLTGLSPVITIVLSLLIYSVWPQPSLMLGILVAVIAIYLISD